MASLAHLFVFGHALAALGAPSLVGTWETYPDMLPALQLPHAPLSGNGHLGLILDASSKARNGSAAGPGATNTLDVWINTNSLWSCTTCGGGIDPDNVSLACCSAVALGGLSIRLAPTFGADPLPAFYATQAIANATLSTRFSTPTNGTVDATLNVHPQQDVAIANVSYSPAAGDPPSLVLDFATWVLYDGSISGSWNTGVPAPARAGCAGADGSEQPCPGLSSGGCMAFVSRNASTRSAVVMPLTAAIATGVVLGPGASLVGSAVTSDPAGPPGAPWEVTLRVSVPAGSWAAAVTAEAEDRGPALGDPVRPALALAAAVLSAPPGAVAAASSAWWSSFWAASSVSLPSQPAAQALWEGAQYVLACASSAVVSADKPGPGLYGPWSTVDGPNWHGDLTLDYNYAAPFYGVYGEALFVCVCGGGWKEKGSKPAPLSPPHPRKTGSNHPDVAAAYWAPISDWMPRAQAKAQVQAGLARVSCPATALYFNCHLAPWGLSSLDPSECRLLHRPIRQLL